MPFERGADLWGSSQSHRSQVAADIIHTQGCRNKRYASCEAKDELHVGSSYWVVQADATLKWIGPCFAETKYQITVSPLLVLSSIVPHHHLPSCLWWMFCRPRAASIPRRTRRISRRPRLASTPERVAEAPTEVAFARTTPRPTGPLRAGLINFWPPLRGMFSCSLACSMIIRASLILFESCDRSEVRVYV